MGFSKLTLYFYTFNCIFLECFFPSFVKLNEFTIKETCFHYARIKIVNKLCLFFFRSSLPRVVEPGLRLTGSESDPLDPKSFLNFMPILMNKITNKIAFLCSPYFFPSAVFIVPPPPIFISKEKTRRNLFAAIIY